jgi:hypothetical protein
LLARDKFFHGDFTVREHSNLPPCLNRPAFVIPNVLPVLILDDNALTDRERRHFSRLDKI